MSILNCNTRLNIVNCTGLSAQFVLRPSKGHMRLQPVGTAHVIGSIDTEAGSLTDWIREWVQLISYGPTHNRLHWTVAAESEETVRFMVESPMEVEMEWTDPSVSWATAIAGKWTIDVSKAVEVTLYVRGDIGAYQKKKTLSGPAVVASVFLKPHLEIACDEDIPFAMVQEPVAEMYWRPGIDLQKVVSPQGAS